MNPRLARLAADELATVHERRDREWHPRSRVGRRLAEPVPEPAGPAPADVIEQLIDAIVPDRRGLA